MSRVVGAATVAELQGAVYAALNIQHVLQFICEVRHSTGLSLLKAGCVVDRSRRTDVTSRRKARDKVGLNIYFSNTIAESGHKIIKTNCPIENNTHTGL